MCLFSPGEKKTFIHCLYTNYSFPMKYFPAVINYKSCTFANRFISRSCLLHLFLPLLSVLYARSLCQVNFLSLPVSLFVLHTFTSFHLLILSFMCWSLQVFPLYSQHSSLLDLWLFVQLCCLSLGSFLFRSLEPSHLFVFWVLHSTALSYSKITPAVWSFANHVGF